MSEWQHQVAVFQLRCGLQSESYKPAPASQIGSGFKTPTHILMGLCNCLCIRFQGIRGLESWLDRHPQSGDSEPESED